VKIEMKVDWDKVKKPRKRMSKPNVHPGIPTSRSERRLWYIAIAREIEARIHDGRFISMAEAAKLCGVSRARVSQLQSAQLNNSNSPQSNCSIGISND
jgi:predicted DNA-binding protein (UPF0251 family)